jgi:hypothetical protein
MVDPSEGQSCPLMERQMNAFTHKPEGSLTGVYFHPTHTKALWNKVWAEARKQDWFADDVGCVGNKDGFFYFQKPRITTGFARVKVEG